MLCQPQSSFPRIEKAVGASAKIACQCDKAYDNECNSRTSPHLGLSDKSSSGILQRDRLPQEFSSWWSHEPIKLNQAQENKDFKRWGHYRTRWARRRRPKNESLRLHYAIEHELHEEQLRCELAARKTFSFSSRVQVPRQYPQEQICLSQQHQREAIRDHLQKGTNNLEGINDKATAEETIQHYW